MTYQSIFQINIILGNRLEKKRNFEEKHKFIFKKSKKSQF